MKYGSVCSGIEAASVAWSGLGWKATWYSEIEKFPSEVLAQRWPSVENLGDMTRLSPAVMRGEVEAPDILVGGTPCQAFSVAGMREGLDDPRGELTIKFVGLANAIDITRRAEGKLASIIVWENVPGILSDKENAFGCFLGALVGEDCELQPTGKRWSNAGCVYGPERAAAWRILDAQYFGVAQRRRRVFVVASARKGFDPGAVLFESESVRRDTPPSREASTIVAALTARGVGVCGADDNQAQAGHIIVTGYRMLSLGEYAVDETSSTMKARDYKDATDLVTCFESRQDPIIYGEISGPCNASAPQSSAVLLQPSLASGGGKMVRRLMPVECERLQGFPDNYTRIKWRGKGIDQCPDGPRYKAIGNSMAVPVMQWIGERIDRYLKAVRS
ncbi:MAG: DNA cytosine methyltransferase [Pontibacterium sp.]